MKISETRQDIIKNKLEIHLTELARKYNSEIEGMKREWNLPDRVPKINDTHIEHMQAIADFVVDTYLKAYQAENKLADDSDTAEIVLELTGLLNEKTHKRDSNLSPRHTLFNDTERSIKDILDGARLSIEAAMAEAKLDLVIQEQNRVNQNLLLEKEQKRYRILNRIYKETNGNTMLDVDKELVSQKEGLAAEELDEIVNYLVGERLIKRSTFTRVGIEHLGVKEMEDSFRHPSRDTEHFQSTIIQHFHGPVHNVQTGNQNTQNVTININPEISEAISKLFELVSGSALGETEKDDATEALERLGKLAGKEKTPDVIEAATKRLTFLKTSFEVVKLSAPAWPYLERLYHWFQGLAQ